MAASRGHFGMHPRSLRRWRARQQRVGYDGLLDRRRQRPSPRLAPFAENRTLQDRLVNELRLAGITTLETANAYLRERFMPDYDARFSHPPADPTTAFVALGVDLDQLLCEEDE